MKHQHLNALSTLHLQPRILVVDALKFLYFIKLLKHLQSQETSKISLLLSFSILRLRFYLQDSNIPVGNL